MTRIAELAVPPAAGDVRVWRLDLRGEPADRERALLGAGDRERAAAMAPVVAERFLARRALAGEVLAGLLGCAPGDLRWDDEDGRPFAAGGGRRTWVSLSSAGSVALLAASPAPVGVDLELAGTPLPDAAEVASTFFTPEEAAWVGGDPARFLATWVRKEAVVKATGEGMRRVLDSFVVDPAAPVAPVRHADGRPFGLRTVAVDADDLVAALAVPGG